MVAGRGPRWLDRLRATFGRTAREEPSHSGHPDAPSRSQEVVRRPPTASDRPRDARDTPDGPAQRTVEGAPTGATGAQVPDEAPEVDGAPAPEGTPAPDEAVAPEAPAPGEVAGDPAGAADDDVPPVRVHEGRLERQVDPLALSPTEALRLAREGRSSLVRRDLPPDTTSGDEDADA